MVKKEKYFADEHVSDLRRAGKHNRAISDLSKINKIENIW